MCCSEDFSLHKVSPPVRLALLFLASSSIKVMELCANNLPYNCILFHKRYISILVIYSVVPAVMFLNSITYLNVVENVDMIRFVHTIHDWKLETMCHRNSHWRLFDKQHWRLTFWGPLTNWLTNSIHHTIDRPTDQHTRINVKVLMQSFNIVCLKLR